MKGTDTLHPPSRHCVHNVFSSHSGIRKGFEVERGAVFEGSIFLDGTRILVEGGEHFVIGESECIARTGHGDVRRGG